MRHRIKKRRKGDSRTSPLGLVEEAFHLLRTAPMKSLWLYFAGSIPFVLSLYYFWADMSRSSYAARDAAAGALGVTLAYFWMKFWQALFCRRLWEQLNPAGQPVELSRWGYLRSFAALVLVQSVSIPVRLISFVFIGWTWAFFQNATVLTFTQGFGRTPLRQLIARSASLSHRNAGQNYVVLIIMLVLGLFTFANVFGAAVLIPTVLKSLFGIETVFTLNPMATLLNTTFLFGAVLLGYLVFDPLMKAVYVLRCFYGVSRRSGSDLVSRLAAIRIEKGRAAIPVVENPEPSAGGKIQRHSGFVSSLISTGLIWTALLAPSSAQENPEALPRTTPADLQNSIDETLKQKQYQWRLDRNLVGNEGEEKGWLEQTTTDLAEAFEKAVKNISKSIEEFFKRFSQPEGGSGSGSGNRSGAGSGSGAGLKGFLELALFIAVLALVIWLVVLLAKRYKSPEKPDPGEVIPTGPIDLESETIVASQLHEDEWIRLADEQIAKGEHRLAIRALFLASLAHLGERGLIRVARFKSNRDYSRELDLKARPFPDLRTAFGENVGLFERVWYGLHEIGQAAISRFRSNYEQITWTPPVPPDEPAHA